MVVTVDSIEWSDSRTGPPYAPHNLYTRSRVVRSLTHMATAPAARYVVPPAAIAHYRARGWCVLEDVVSPGELARIRGIADAMVAGEIDTRANRADLGGHTDRVAGAAGPENIIQIAWPTDLTSELDENELIIAGRAISDALYGDAPGSFVMDMNQFLVKPPHSTVDTPLHIDGARPPPRGTDGEPRWAQPWHKGGACPRHGRSVHVPPPAPAFHGRHGHSILDPVSLSHVRLQRPITSRSPIHAAATSGSRWRT